MEKEQETNNFNDFGKIFKMSRVNLKFILERDGKVKHLDKKANCLYTLTRCLGIRNYSSGNSICFKKEDLNTGIIEEEYYSVISYLDYIEVTKKISDLRENNLLYSRCYADVKTKYGTFCLEADEMYDNDYETHCTNCFKDCYKPKHRAITLYNVTHDNNNFKNIGFPCVYPYFGVLKFKSVPKSNFNQWHLGYIDDLYQNPRRSIWNYNIVAEKSEEKVPIYCISDYADELGFRGAIILDGSIKTTNIKNCLPNYFTNLEVDEYEKKEVTSKIYYGAGNTIVVLKKGYEINVIYNVYNPRKNKNDEKESVNIISLTNGKFTKDDFEKIISSLELMDIDRELKESFITELVTYINVHTSDFTSLTDTLTDISYEELKEIMMDSNLTEFTEKLIENMSETFGISTSDLIGKKGIEKGLSRKINK